MQNIKRPCYTTQACCNNRLGFYPIRLSPFNAHKCIPMNWIFHGTLNIKGILTSCRQHVLWSTTCMRKPTPLWRFGRKYNFNSPKFEKIQQLQHYSSQVGATSAIVVFFLLNLVDPINWCHGQGSKLVPHHFDKLSTQSRVHFALGHPQIILWI